MRLLAPFFIKIGCILLGHPPAVAFMDDWQEARRLMMRQANIPGFEVRVECACGARMVDPRWESPSERKRRD